MSTTTITTPERDRPALVRIADALLLLNQSSGERYGEALALVAEAMLKLDESASEQAFVHEVETIAKEMSASDAKEWVAEVTEEAASALRDAAVILAAQAKKGAAL